MMFKALLRRNFALLWGGQFISSIGDWALMIALPFYVYQLTGSVLQTGVMFIVETLPRILFGSLVGVFVDRWNRRRTMIISELLRAGVLLILLLVHSSSMLWLVYIVACTQASIALFFNPAYAAITPLLVEEEQLTAANSLEAFSDAATRFIGPPLGGVLLGLLGLQSIVFIDSVSFLFSSLMVLLINMPVSQGTEEDEKAETAPEVTLLWKKVWQEWVEGLGLVRKDLTVSAIFLTMGVLMVAQGIINVVLLIFVHNILHGDASIYGLLITTQGIGTLVGSLLIEQANKLLRPAYLSALTLGISGAAFLAFINFPSLLSGLLLIPVMGVFAIIFFVTAQTLLQKSVPDIQRGRIFASFGTTISLSIVIGMGLVSLAGDRLGPVVLLNGAGILIVSGGIIALFTLSNSNTRIAQQAPTEQKEAGTLPAD
jgi:MFS family permease